RFLAPAVADRHHEVHRDQRRHDHADRAEVEDDHVRIERHVSLRRTNTRTNGVIENSQWTSKRFREKHSTQVRREWKCRTPGPKARKLARSRRCSAMTTRPPGPSTRRSSTKSARRASSLRSSSAQRRSLAPLTVPV